MTVSPLIAQDQVTRGLVDAVVVTFGPDLAHFGLALERVLPQVRRLLVVDNGSKNLSELEAVLTSRPHVELVSLGSNRGIAAALNVGVDWALAGHPGPAWLLTLDQDTILQEHAIARVLCAFGDLDVAERESCALLAMRYRPITPQRGLWGWLERDRTLGNTGAFQERTTAISSGSLIRFDRLGGTRFDEKLFMDQVDSAFCAALRREGHRIFEYREVTMDHQIGTLLVIGGRNRGYQNGQRLYYIVRNSTLLLSRRDIPVSAYVVQLLFNFRSYLFANGLRALPRAFAILCCGLVDAASGRFGQREYRFVRDPPRWSERYYVGEQPARPTSI